MQSSMNNSLGITATPLLGHVSLNATLHVPTASKLLVKRSAHRLLIVLDCSGSMANGSLAAAQNALCIALPSLRRDFSHVHLIPFHSRAASTDLSHQPSLTAERLIRRLKARGSTNFAAFFDIVLETLTLTDLQPGDATSIVVLSDGADTHGLHDRVASVDACLAFRAALREAAPVSQFHAIGLGKKHDPAMMALLATIGTVPGTFTFARGATQVEDALKEQLSMATQHVLPVKLSLRDGNEVTLRKLSANFARRSGALDDTCEGSAADAEIYDLETYFQHDASECIAAATVQFADGVLSTVVNYAQNSMDGFLSNTTTTTPSELRALCATARALTSDLATNLVSDFPLQQFDTAYLTEKHRELSALSSKLFDYVLPLCSQNKAAKADVYHSLSILRQLLSDILLPALRGAPVKDMRFAKLVDLAYTDVRNKRLHGLLQKRAVANRVRLECLESDVASVISKAPINACPCCKPADVERYGKCLYSIMDVKELQLHGDCLCLTLDIRRPEAAIADPSRLVVLGVGPSVISSDALLHSLQFRLLESHDSDEGFGVHGGFGNNRYRAEIIPGVARESITGGLPLFVCETHWKIAKLRALPLLGWMFTLDVLGFSQEQLRVLPFLVLDKLRFGPDVSTFHSRIQRWVLDVCVVVLRENPTIGQTLFAETQKHRLRYLHDPTSRLQDVVASNKVFAMQLYVACQIDNIQIPEDERKFMAFLMVVEQVRRVRRARKTSIPNSNVEQGPKGVKPLTRASLVGVSEENVVQGVMAGLSNTVSHCPAINSPFETVDEENSETRLKPWRVFTNCSRSEETIGQEPHKAAGRVTSTPSLWDASRKPTGALKHALKEVAAQTAIICPRLELSWKMTHAQRVCALDLVVMWPSGASIRSDTAGFQRACEHAFTKSASYMEAAAMEIVTGIQRRVQRNAFSQRSAENDAAMARLFLETPDVNDAAGLVRGWLYVGRNISLIVKVLLGLPHRGMETIRVQDDSTGSEKIERRVVCAKEPLLKMRLLCRGSIGDVDELYADKDAAKRRQRFDGLAWRPCRKWVRLLFKSLVLDVLALEEMWSGVVDATEVAEWVREFPWVERELCIWAEEMSKR